MHRSKRQRRALHLLCMSSISNPTHPNPPPLCLLLINDSQCAAGWQPIFAGTVEQGAYADCKQGSYQYGPVGCAAAPTNDGEIICSAKGCYWKQAAGGGPAGCFCCTTNC